MFLHIQQFTDLWRTESAVTQRVIGRLTDKSLSIRAAPGARSAGETAWHIAAAIRDIGGLTGLPLSGPRRGDPVPSQSADIITAYQRASTELVATVTAQWSDATLRIADDVYGERWFRGRTLFVLLAHEIHHRGQLTVALRAAGLTIPAVYGPSSDEEYRPHRPS